MPTKALYTSSPIDNLTAAYVEVIYQKYIQDNNKNIGALVLDALENLPAGTPESTQIVLEWFFSNQDGIEAWYLVQNISYENNWISNILSRINELYLDNKISNFLHQGTSLQQLLTPYALRKEAASFYSNYQQFGATEASKIALTNTTQVLQKRILLIKKGIENEKGPTISNEQKTEIIKNFIILSIDSVTRYIPPLSISEEEQVGIMLYVAQIQLFLEPIISSEKFELNDDEEINKSIESAISPKNLHQLVSNGINYGKKLSTTLTTRSFSKIYLSISQRENTTDDDLIYYLAYKLHQELLKKGLLSTYLKSNEFDNSKEYEEVYKNAQIEYETYIYHQRLREKGKRAFKALTTKAEPTKILILKNYILLSLHKNTIKEKYDNAVDILIRRLLDCLGGDIKNRRATKYPEIFLEDLTKIYESNPEIRDYLLAFIEALDEIPEELTMEESIDACTKQYAMLKKVIIAYEETQRNNSLPLSPQILLAMEPTPLIIPSEQTDSTISLDTPLSTISDEVATTEESSDSDDNSLVIATLELDGIENVPPLEGKSNRTTIILAEENIPKTILHSDDEESTPETILHPDDLVSNYQIQLVNAYCIYNLAETTKSPGNPQATGKIFAWEFIYNSQNKGATLFEILYNKELPTSTYSSKQLDEFWNNFFSEITAPMCLGQYSEAITEICKKDYTFFTLLLAYHTQKLNIALKETKKIGYNLTEEQLFLDFFTNILNELEEAFQKIDKKSYANSWRMHSEPAWASTSAQKCKELSQKIKQINQLPSNVSILSPAITKLFLQCNTLKNDLKAKQEDLNRQAGQVTATRLFTGLFYENLGEILNSLTLKDQVEEFIAGFMEEVNKRKAHNGKRVDYFLKNDPTFAALYITYFFKQHSILKEIFRKNIHFKSSLFHSLIPEIIPKLIDIWRQQFQTVKKQKNDGTNTANFEKDFNKISQQIKDVLAILKIFKYTDDSLKNLKNEVLAYGKESLGVVTQQSQHRR